MKIQPKDYYHGAALTQIVEDDSFTALNKASHKYGHYQINHDRRILVKRSGSDREPWQFTINPDDHSVIVADMGSDQTLFLCLVCGLDSIAVLDEAQIAIVINLANTAQQWIRIKKTPGNRLAVKGSFGELTKMIANSHFPAQIFG